MAATRLGASSFVGCYEELHLWLAYIERAAASEGIAGACTLALAQACLRDTAQLLL